MLKHPLKPLLMVSFIYKFFENLEKVFNNFSRCLRRRKREETIIFSDDRPPHPWRRDPPKNSDTNANESIL